MAFKFAGLDEIAQAGDFGQSCPIELSAIIEIFYVHVVLYSHMPIEPLKCSECS